MLQSTAIVDISWLGYSCFEITGKRTKIITDPYSEEIGLKLPPLEADIVTISHPHPGHSNSQVIGGNPRVINRPGEYEINGIFITGLDSFHDNSGGKIRGKNIIYIIEIDGLTICHLGDLGHILSDQQIEDMGGIDILLIPVGDANSLDAVTAAQVIRQLEPKIVIPMHYMTPGLNKELDGIDRFLKEIGNGKIEPRPKLRISEKGLSESTETILLERRVPSQPIS